MSFAGLTFLIPWLLPALLLLPLLWWLLRATPPAPKQQRFPALRLLLGLVPEEETPARTPWWLLLLRLLIAALIVLALARPVWQEEPASQGRGPLLLVVDNGWAAAPRWEEHRAVLDRLLAGTEQAGLSVYILPTAAGPDGSKPTLSNAVTAAEARRRLSRLEPRPWPADRAAAAEALAGLNDPDIGDVVWASDGIVSSADDAEGVTALGQALYRLGPVRLLSEPVGRLALLLRPPLDRGENLTLVVERPGGGPKHSVTAVAKRADGRTLARVPVTFFEGATLAEAPMPLPLELRNAIGRIELGEERSAGATLLVDAAARRNAVGLVDEGLEEEAQPLLSELHYVEQAVATNAVVRRGSLESLLQGGVRMLILPDRGALPVATVRQLESFIDEGGVVLRFAGPQLAGSPDGLVPVRFRGGERRLGGVMSWEDPARIAPFEKGPFQGLTVPEDVEIQQQILAEPTLQLAERTWARLSDGTPVVTARQEGAGWLVLVHTTANADWSNLPLSLLFVEMLQRIVDLAKGTPQLALDQSLPPQALLDAFGRLRDPSPSVLDLNAEVLEEGGVGPRHPPGVYGAGAVTRVLNLEAAVPQLSVLQTPAGLNRSGYEAGEVLELRPLLLGLATLLLIADLFIALLLRGLLPRARRTATPAALLLLAFAMAPADALAVDDGLAMQATRETHLAYVLTGDNRVDAISEAGLSGLSSILNRRTAVEAGAPIGVDIEKDPLVFYSLLYWPITEDQTAPSPEAAERLNRFMETGGTILFDLRDASGGGPYAASTAALKRVVSNLEIPPLSPVPPEHVLTKAFYLLQNFPGRYDNGDLWIDGSGTSGNDGVARVMIGSNDFAAAWAADRRGRPLFAAVPGGERQREMAFRFGVNLVLYALTGNYKADQVHVPFILERLGQ